MTSITDDKKVNWWPVINFITSCALVFTIVYFVIMTSVIYITANRLGDEKSMDWLVGLIIMLTVVYTMIFILVLVESSSTFKMPLPQKFNDWFHKMSRGNVWRMNVLLIFLTIVMSSTFLLAYQANQELSTPDGYLRVMNDGRVLYPGTIVPHNPLKVTSVLLPEEQSKINLNHRIVEVQANGVEYTRRVVVNMTIGIDHNDSFVSLVSSIGAEDLGMGLDTWDQTLARRQEYSNATYTAISFDTMAKELVAELDSGVIGTDPLALRLRAAEYLKGQSLPLWIEYMYVTEVTVQKVGVIRN